MRSLFSVSVPLPGHTRSTSALSEKLEALTDRNRASRRRQLHETEIDNKLGCLGCQLERQQLHHRKLRQDLTLEGAGRRFSRSFPVLLPWLASFPTNGCVRQNVGEKTAHIPANAATGKGLTGRDA